jgi:hypothetical protein
LGAIAVKLGSSKQGTTTSTTATPSVSGKYCAGLYDVASSSKYCSAIEAVVNAGIFKGYANGTFRPSENINRAETAKVIAAAFGIQIVTNDFGTFVFNDVRMADWFGPYVKALKDEGISKGYAVDNTYRPANNVTKAEFVKLVLAAAGKENEVSACSASGFNDAPLLAWYGRYLCYAKKIGLITADGAGNYYPNAAITRAEAADVLNQAINEKLIK